MPSRRERELQGPEIRLIVEGEWTDAVGRDAAAGGFDILELHRGRQEDFSFLPPLAAQLRKLWINCESGSAAGLEQLVALDSLTLGFPLRKPFDFQRLAGLRHLRIEAWQPWYAQTLFAHPTLETLHIEGYDAADVSGPASLPKLASLSLAKGRVKDLMPLRGSKTLHSLRLSHLKAITSVDVVGQLPALEHLSLGDALPAVEDVAAVFGCRALRSLAVVGTRAEIPQTAWLRGFQQLRDLRLQSGVQQFEWRDLFASPLLKKLALVFTAPLTAGDADVRREAAGAGLRVRELVRFGTKKRPALLIEFD